VADAFEVKEFHRRSDLDSSQFAQHHTLGAGHDQASPGDHKHDGTSSKLLLEGVELTGDYSSGTVLENLVALLVEHFGLTDSTTP
jgi:hypothetical protein